MKVMFLVHQYWPLYQSGTENYTHYLAQALAARGAAVTVVAAEPLSTGDYRVEEGREGPVRVFKIHKDIALRGGLLTAAHDERFEEAFASLCEGEAPDVLHIQHLLFTSLGIPRLAKESLGLPVVFTLHDFWMECPRVIRLDTRGRRCPGWSPEGCARCLAEDAPPGGSRATPASLLRRLRSHLPFLTLPRLVRLSARSMRALLPARRPDTAAVLRRRREMMAAAASVDLFVSPSAFLRDSLVRWGLPAERVLVSRNGMPVPRRPRAPAPPPREGPVRFVFTSVVKPEKGVLVALDAFETLWRQGERRARLVMHGRIPDEEGFGRLFRRRIAALPNAEYGGAFRNADLPPLLRGAHFLLLPSTWYENAPLVIDEAHLHGVPCVVSDIGGMAERVDHDRNGAHFRAGDPDDLARQVARLTAHPELGEGFRRRLPPVKTVEENAAELERLYEELRAGRPGAEAD